REESQRRRGALHSFSSMPPLVYNFLQLLPQEFYLVFSKSSSGKLELNSKAGGVAQSRGPYSGRSSAGGVSPDPSDSLTGAPFLVQMDVSALARGRLRWIYRARNLAAPIGAMVCRRCSEVRAGDVDHPGKV